MSSEPRRDKATTVLVVDDSPVDRMLVGNILEREKLVALYAESGMQALEQLAHDPPDAVMTDLQMPGMDGLALVREVRKSFPWIPIILMTGRGSEEIAAEALRHGAASYVAKRNLSRDLPEAMSSILAAIESQREQVWVRELLHCCEFAYRVGYEPEAPKILVNHLQDNLARMGICDEIGRLRAGTALAEALMNAIDHGNLELDSALRDNGNAYRQLGRQRAEQLPYRDRRVHVTARLTTAEATFVIRDEGPGFDPSSLPDPTDPANLTRVSGRGVMLIRTFMDDVQFNDKGNEITLVLRRASPM